MRVDHAKIFNVVPDEPAVLMYAATNTTDDDLEQFMVLVFFYDAEGTLKARADCARAAYPREAHHQVPRPWSSTAGR